jgi:V/A-type H+-transporting ATPase subunit I
MTNLSWMIFIIGFFGWALYSWMAGLAGITPLPPVGVKVVLGIMLVGVAFIIVNAIRTSKHTVGGVITGFLGGLYRVYGVSSYVSDLLSYARLLALGLSGIVFQRLQFPRFMVYDGVPVKAVGMIGLFAILAFGHVFNFVLSAFGAFVHSLRLQFVEFFSKFLKSGGKSYEPLKEEGLYYDIKTEQN